jgi:splicing factor 3A subunit 2
VGSKFGGGGVAGASETNVDRRERLRKLALETIDLAKVYFMMPASSLSYILSSQDPYILRNHLGSLECRLCLTLHTNEGSYLAHTQGKKHQTNLARRAARDAKESQLLIAPTPSNIQRKVFLKIGRPGYRVTKVRDQETGKEGMMVQVHLPQIKAGVIPRRRFMSAWEQKREPPNRAYQYLIVRFSFPLSQDKFLNSPFSKVAAEPYETIAFRIPAREIEDETDDAGYWNWSHWDPDTKQYSFQFMFRLQY